MAKRLTARSVELAKPNRSKRIEIPDAGKPGLYLVIQPSGRKSWAVRYRRLSDRAPRKFTIEGFPSLAVAHKLAQEALDKVAEGHDPAQAKRQERATEHAPNDLKSAFCDFLNRHRRKKNGQPVRESTRRERARLFGLRPDPDKDAGTWIETGNGVLKHWRNKSLDHIHKADVHDLLDHAGDQGPVLANRLLGALRTFFGWCVKRGRLEKSPCDGIDAPHPETTRDRVLSDTELAALWRVADADGYAFGPMVKLLALTGCRRDEVRRAVWSEFDLPAKQWLIPGHRTKNGHDHLVPLSDTAIGILESLPRIKGAGLLFTTTGETPISGLTRARARLHDAIARELGAEPENFTLHDLRRTFVSGLQRLGHPLEVCEAAVNHKSGLVAGVAAVYAKHDYLKEKRAAMDEWARHVEAIVAGKPADIVQFKKARR